MRRNVLIGLCAAGLTALVGCGGGETQASGPAPGTTVTATQTVTATPAPDPSDLDEFTPDAPLDSPTNPLSEDPSSAPEPSTLSTEQSGRPLALGQAHAVVGEWEQDRFEVADRSDVTGMGVEVDQCTQTGYELPELEYRLANRFENLSLSVSQANASVSSEQQLVVVLMANGEQVDIQRVPFNQTKPLTLDVSGVNALRLMFSLDDETVEDCSSNGSVIAVVEDLTVT